MFEVCFRCLGLTPLLMNRAGDERLAIWRERPGDQVPLADSAADFESRIYRDPSGRVAIPVDMLMSALNVAGRHVKVGKARVATKGSSTLASLLRIVEEWIPLDAGTSGTNPTLIPYVRKAKLREGRQRKPYRLVRPKIPSWGFAFTIRVVSKTHVEIGTRLVTIAGTEAGLGDFRPSLPNKSGWKSPFGQFRTESVEVVEVEPAPDELDEISVPGYEELEATRVV